MFNYNHNFSQNQDIATKATSLITYKIILNFYNNYSADWRDLPNIGTILNAVY